MRILAPLAITSFAGLAACAGAGSDPEAGTAPTPFSAAEIRAANPTGTELVYRIRDLEGPSGVQTIRFVSSGSGSARLAVTMDGFDGQPLGPAETMRSSWAELRDHAAFPADRTHRVRSTCTVPARTFDCWVYSVIQDASTVSRFHFALDLPGPPVRLETTRDGSEVFLMELLEVRRP